MKALLLASILCAWFVCPFEQMPGKPAEYRQCAMARYDARIRATGGSWAASECLGNHAVCKVTAPDSLLADIATTDGFLMFPAEFIDSPVAGMSFGDQLLFTAKAGELGYSIPEIQAALPLDLGNYTLRDLLNFVLTRRQDPRFDEATQTIVLDGMTRSCKSADQLDAEVPDTLR
jgi:hypothetical protein